MTTHLFSPTRRSIAGMVRVAFPTLVVDIGDPDFLQRWSSSTRTKVNKASHDNLLIGRGSDLLPQVLDLFGSTARRRGLKGYPAHHFDAFPHVECSAAFLDGVMLCGHVWIIDDEGRRACLYVNASAHHDGTEVSSLYGRAHYYLLWQDGIFLREGGIMTLDLQGYDPGSGQQDLEGVYRWKAGTHGTQETLYHYYPAWFHGIRRMREILGR